MLAVVPLKSLGEASMIVFDPTLLTAFASLGSAKAGLVWALRPKP